LKFQNNRLNISPKVFDFALLDNQSPFEWRNEYASIYSEISKDFFRYQLINLRGREIDPSVLEKNFIPKGLYNAADQGEIKDLVGYSDINPYEKPSDANFIVNTDSKISLSVSKESLLKFIKSITN
jgi:hypothetical protein